MNAGSDNIIRVTLDAQANVLLLDPANYNKYKAGQDYRYHGGLTEQSPVDLVPPHTGTWHVVIDRGGYGGRVRAQVEVL